MLFNATFLYTARKWPLEVFEHVRHTEGSDDLTGVVIVLTGMDDLVGVKSDLIGDVTGVLNDLIAVDCRYFWELLTGVTACSIADERAISMMLTECA